MAYQHIGIISLNTEHKFFRAADVHWSELADPTTLVQMCHSGQSLLSPAMTLPILIS